MANQNALLYDTRLSNIGNRLLFDLIHCFHGDLPHIVEVSWEGYFENKVMSFENFQKLVGKGLTVKFDKAMKRETINQHTFLVAVITKDDRSGYWTRGYIPPADFTYDDNKQTATFNMASYAANRVIETQSAVGAHGAEVEIILRGSLIKAENNKALDGDFIGERFPTGNGSQGGDFVSTFHVRPADTQTRRRRRQK